MPRTLRHALVALTAALACACGGTADPEAVVAEAWESLEAGHAREALVELDWVLARLDESHPTWRRAALGRIKALVDLAPDKAVDEFLHFAAADGPRLEEYREITRWLTASGHHAQALELFEATKQAFPDAFASPSAYPTRRLEQVVVG